MTHSVGVSKFPTFFHLYIKYEKQLWKDYCFPEKQNENRNTQLYKVFE